MTGQGVFPGGGSFLIFPRQKPLVEPDAPQPQQAGAGEDGKGEPQLVAGEAGPRPGGGDHRGDAGQGGEDQKPPQGQGTEGADIDQDILWGAGDEVEEEHQPLQPGLLLQKTVLPQLGSQGGALKGGAALFPHRQEHPGAAQQAPQQTEGQATPGPVHPPPVPPAPRG